MQVRALCLSVLLEDYVEDNAGIRRRGLYTVEATTRCKQIGQSFAWVASKRVLHVWGGGD
jgi:hypothetical protein